MRGDIMNTSWISTVFLRGMGGSYVEDVHSGNYKPTLNSKSVIDSTKLYADLMA